MAESPASRQRGNGGAGKRSRHGRRLLLIAGAIGLEVVPLWQRGYGIGGNVVVRCREGHLFTTIWLPAVSVKSLRFGWWRIQRCPVGGHWSIVTPVDRSECREADRAAAAQRDIRVP